MIEGIVSQLHAAPPIAIFTVALTLLINSPDMTLHCFLLIATSVVNFLFTWVVFSSSSMKWSVSFTIKAFSVSGGFLWNFVFLLVSALAGVEDGHRQYLLVCMFSAIFFSASGVFLLSNALPTWQHQTRVYKLMGTYGLTKPQSTALIAKHDVFTEVILEEEIHEHLAKYPDGPDRLCAWKDRVSQLLE